VAVRDFKSDSSGEWVVEDGDFATVADADAVPQGIRIRVGMFLGECYLDESIGVDYIDSVFIKNADQLVNEGGRAYSISYAVDTVYSDETVAGQIGVT
jgi:hypothetical protein